MWVVSDPRSPVAEAFRSLRTSLRYTVDKDSCRVLLVTSANPSDGKTAIATNLATSLAQAGERVLVIDADIRKPRCHRVFSVRNRTGLTNVLVDSVAASDAVQATDVDGLSVLTSGPIPPNPAELLGSTATDRLLSQVRGEYDHVLVDCPPVIGLADAPILASKVDGIILVLNSGETRIDQALHVKEELELAKGRILGVVLNRVKYNGRDYRYRYYRYYGDRRSDETVDEDVLE